VEVCGEPKQASNWIMGEILRLLKEERTPLDQLKVPPSQLGKLILMIKEGNISGKIAKTVFAEMSHSGKNPQEIVAEKGLTQITDNKAILSICREVVEKNPQEVTAFRGGKEKLMGFFVGQVMQASKGKANPNLVNKALRSFLSEPSK